MLLNIIVKLLKTFKKADDVTALLYAIIKSKVIKLKQEYIKNVKQ